MQHALFPQVAHGRKTEHLFEALGEDGTRHERGCGESRYGPLDSGLRLHRSKRGEDSLRLRDLPVAYVVAQSKRLGLVGLQQEHLQEASLD